MPLPLRTSRSARCVLPGPPNAGVIAVRDIEAPQAAHRSACTSGRFPLSSMSTRCIRARNSAPRIDPTQTLRKKFLRPAAAELCQAACKRSRTRVQAVVVQRFGSGIKKCLRSGHYALRQNGPRAELRRRLTPNPVWRSHCASPNELPPHPHIAREEDDHGHRTMRLADFGQRAGGVVYRGVRIEPLFSPPDPARVAGASVTSSGRAPPGHPPARSDADCHCRLRL
jgi:hypothetical protein